jgi:hypothetical protein
MDWSRPQWNRFGKNRRPAFLRRGRGSQRYNLGNQKSAERLEESAPVGQKAIG